MIAVLRCCAALILFIALCQFPVQADTGLRDVAVFPDQSLDISNQEPPEELILEVQLNGIVIGQVFGYARGERTYLPVYELASQLSFPAELLEYPHVLEAAESPILPGYSILATADGLELKGAQGSVSWPEVSWLREQYDFDGELYLQTEYLMELWPLTLEVNIRGMELKISSKIDLPVLAQLRRKTFRKKYLRQRAQRDKSQSEQGLPYSLYSPPIFNWHLSQLQTRYSTESSFGLRARQDTLGMGTSGSIQLSGQDDNYKLSSFSLRSRYDARNDPIASDANWTVRELEFGNINISGSSVNDITSGTGLAFSNRNGDRSVFASHTVSSSAQPGWEADLYLNQRLIGFQRIDETGLYSFDLKLPPGDNKVNVRLYGPYGEERIDRYVFDISSDYLPDGEWGYWVSALSPRTSFYQQSESDSVYRYVLETSMGYGIGSGIDLRGRITHKSLIDSGSATILGLSSNFSVGSVSVRTESYFEKGSMLAKLGLSYSNEDFDTVLNYASHNDWPDHLREDNYLEESVSGRINTSTRFFEHPVSLESSFALRKFASRSEKRFSLSQNFNLKGITVGLKESCSYGDSVTCALTNRLRYRTRLARLGFEWKAEQKESELSHAFMGRVSMGLGTLIREYKLWQLDEDAGALEQALDGLMRASRLTLEYDGEYSEAEQAQGNTYDFDEGGMISLSTTHEFSRLKMGLLASWSSNDGMAVRLNLSGALYPESSGYRADYQRFDKAAEVRVFSDLDYDGVFGEGDELLENIKVRQGSRSSRGTDSNGVAWLNLQDGLPLEVDYRTLEDPYMVPSRPAEVVSARRERVARIEMPIISTGAIEGALLSAEGEAYPNRKLELRDQHTGRAVTEMYTAIDGFFVFEFVPPGDYLIVMHFAGEQIPLSRVSLGQDDMWPVVNLTY